MQSRSRTWVWLLTAIAIGAALGFLAHRAFSPGDGAAIPFYADAWQGGGARIEISGNAMSELRSGDVVVGVAGRPLDAWFGAALDGSVDRSVLAAPVAPYEIDRQGVRTTVRVAAVQSDIVPPLLENWSALAFTIVLQALAIYVLLRRPAASAAAALALIAVGVTGSTIPWLLGLQVRDVVAGWPFLLYALTAGGIYMVLWPAGALHLPLALATTAAPPRRTLALAYGLPLGAYAVLLVVGRIAAGDWVAWMGTWATAQLAVIVPTILIGIAYAAWSFRRATPEARQRLRWVLAGGATSTVASLALLLVPELLTGRTLIPWSAVGIVALPLPLGIAAGILRSSLFDIQVVINRALVYGGATASILVAYAAAVALIGASQGAQGAFAVQMLAIGVAALVALPARDVLQRTVNRLMFGDRDDPYRALTRLGARLESMLDPMEAPAIIVRAIAESLRVPWVAIRLRRLDDGDSGAATLRDAPDVAARRLISHGRQPTGDLVSMPLISGAEVVGELQVAPRSPSEPLSLADRALLGALARQATPALRAVSLTLDLVESRERLVVAREEERRRIRRDLHDGLGPTLAAVGMRAEVAADLAARDPAAAQQVLDEMRSEVRVALADVRRLVDALRPPALDELGLVGALEAQASRLGTDPMIEVQAAESLPALPAAVEVAAYRIAVEAMTNAARHAGARSCRVRLREAEREAGTGSGPVLEVEIEDDGRGIPDAVRPGIGLASMRERASEIGGSLTVARIPSGGTRITARLPLAAQGGAA